MRMHDLVNVAPVPSHEPNQTCSTFAVTVLINNNCLVMTQRWIWLQGACRAVIHINYFLVLHHVMFCTLSVLAFQAENLFMVKICITTSCFATYEVLLYAALISRKVQALCRYFQCLTVLGLTLYGITRLLQTAILISLFVYGFNPMSHTSRNSALYWVGLCMCTALSALQLYTFVIYKAIWQSTKAKAAMHSNAVPSVLKRPRKPDQVCKNALTYSYHDHDHDVTMHRHCSAMLMASLSMEVNMCASITCMRHNTISCHFLCTGLHVCSMCVHS